MLTPDFAYRGALGVLETDAVRKLEAGGAAVRWTPHRFTTRRVDMIEVQLGLCRADVDVMAEAAAAAVSYAVPKIARAEAGAAVRLHVGNGAAAGRGQDFGGRGSSAAAIKTLCWRRPEL